MRQMNWVEFIRCPVGTVLWPWGDILLISKDDKHSLFRLKSVKLTWNQNDWLVVSSCNVPWLIPSRARSITAKRSDDTKHPRNETKGQTKQTVTSRNDDKTARQRETKNHSDITKRKKGRNDEKTCRTFCPQVNFMEETCIDYAVKTKGVHSGI